MTLHAYYTTTPNIHYIMHKTEDNQFACIYSINTNSFSAAAYLVFIINESNSDSGQVSIGSGGVVAWTRTNTTKPPAGSTFILYSR